MRIRGNIERRAVTGRRAGMPGPASVVPCDRHRALVVDDEQTIAVVFAHMISQAIPDLEVESVSNGQAAVEAFGKGHHAVLLMDLSMPVMDGRQAFREIVLMCRARGWEMPRVIFCTGFAPPDLLRDELEGHPEHGLLLKPVSREAIVRAVAQRLS